MITEKQRHRIAILAEDVQAASVKAARAEDALRHAVAVFNDYLHELEEGDQENESDSTGS